MHAVVQQAVALRAGGTRLPASLAVGGAMLVVLASASLLAPLLVPYDPNGQNFDALLQAPTLAHLFGTDNFGRDVLTRVLYGARIDLRVGVLAVVFPFFFGSLIGAVAGYSGGWVDAILMRTVDVLTAVPFFVLVIAILAFLGPGEVNIFLAIGSVGWVTYSRLVRGEVLREKHLEYIAAARALGFSRSRIIVGHLFLNAIPPAVTFVASDVVLIILTTAALGFLGLGIRPPSPEWGMMIAEGREFLSGGWWIATMPGFACMYTGLAFILLGDGIADLLRVRGQ
jgi:peptide/nickel transport system permease protein